MADIRERLMELLDVAATIAGNICGGTGCEDCDGHNNGCTLYHMADHLIANGVTVGKPLVEHLHPIDAYEGLKGTYCVFKADTGEQVVNCFVLRPEKDAAAVEGLRAYANATDNKTLAEDIYNWIGKGVTVQQWIPVAERLPEKDGIYLTFNKKKEYEFHFFQTGKRMWPAVWDEDGVTHWMPLPEPPKGE